LKILLDHNLDRRLKSLLPDHQVHTAQDMDWADALNGELLSLLEENGFEVLITADSKLKDQQNVTGRNMGVIVLRALDNRRTTHAEMMEDIIAALESIKSGNLIGIFHSNVLR
jgi:predicted nuclease of predicted toxin-antitoxin system